MAEARTKVLIVDDEGDLTRMLAVRFEAYGDFRVETAFDGIAALAKVRRLEPDVVLIDVKMPGMGGIELLRRLREEPRTRRTPVIVVTADQSCALEDPPRGAGPQLLVYKPFDVNELVAAARRVVEESRREGVR